LSIQEVRPPLRATERTDYALKAVVLLAQHYGSFLTSQLIADEFGTSPKTLAGVLAALCDAEVLTSRAGWHGGFTLARPPSEVSVAEIIAAVGKRTRPALYADFATPATASVDAFWRALDRKVQEMLSTVTVATLLTDKSPCGGPVVDDPDEVDVA
jgi:Rrf2 family protein